MPGRGRPTFNKRQKEQKRAEKQTVKANRREERKLTSEPLKDEETLAREAVIELAERAAELAAFKEQQMQEEKERAAAEAEAAEEAAQVKPARVGSPVT